MKLFARLAHLFVPSPVDPASPHPGPGLGPPTLAHFAALLDLRARWDRETGDGLAEAAARQRHPAGWWTKHCAGCGHPALAHNDGGDSECPCGCSAFELGGVR